MALRCLLALCAPLGSECVAGGLGHTDGAHKIVPSGASQSLYTHTLIHPPNPTAAMHQHPSPTAHVRLDVMERGGGGGGNDTDTLTQQQTQTAPLPAHLHEDNPLACSWSCFVDEFI
jgi:hypothetical protein